MLTKDTLQRKEDGDVLLATEGPPRLSYAIRLRAVVSISIGFYLVLSSLILGSILHKTGGKFFYALDDPYIHLAMAEQLAHGHYGINAGEASSPSSSILWPLMLVPLAGTSLQVYLPLAWNLLFGIVSAGLIGAVACGWRGTAEPSARRTPWWQQAVIAILLVLLANLVSLTFIGMEHVLQIMLAICCAIGMIEIMEGRSMPAWCIAAAMVAPMVRYEDLALTVAIGIALIGVHQTKKAALVLGVGVLPLIGFSLFLKSLGLPMLPTSVLVKGGASGSSPLAGFLKGIVANVALDVRHLERGTMMLLLLILLFFLVREPSRPRRFVLVGAVFVAAIQLLIGRFGWFHRYEVYALIFLGLIVVRIAAREPRIRFVYIALLLSFCARPFIVAALSPIRGAVEIDEQQYQMHRFVADFYRHDVAVNDIGLVSYQRPRDVYILDVFGLASPEASRQTDKTAPWLADIVQRHGIQMAMLYSAWFKIPPAWTPLAKMCLDSPNQHVSERCVTFYSTSEATKQASLLSLQQFAPTVPSGVDITFLPPTQ